MTKTKSQLLKEIEQAKKQLEVVKDNPYLSKARDNFVYYIKKLEKEYSSLQEERDALGNPLEEHTAHLQNDIINSDDDLENIDNLDIPYDTRESSAKASIEITRRAPTKSRGYKSEIDKLTELLKPTKYQILTGAKGSFPLIGRFIEEGGKRYLQIPGSRQGFNEKKTRLTFSGVPIKIPSVNGKIQFNKTQEARLRMNNALYNHLVINKSINRQVHTRPSDTKLISLPANRYLSFFSNYTVPTNFLTTLDQQNDEFLHSHINRSQYSKQWFPYKIRNPKDLEDAIADLQSKFNGEHIKLDWNYSGITEKNGRPNVEPFTYRHISANNGYIDITNRSQWNEITNRLLNISPEEMAKMYNESSSFKWIAISGINFQVELMNRPKLV